LSCAEVLALADAIAMEALAGELRGAAFRHLHRCFECRAVIAALADTADDLLAAGATIEPPPGFADRVLDRLNARWSCPV
jgi:hypothetical protein